MLNFTNGFLSPVRRSKNTRVMGTSKSNLNYCAESHVNGTNDCEAYPQNWTAVLVQMYAEQKVSTKLNKLGITKIK
jgi:hypothetical protein